MFKGGYMGKYLFVDLTESKVEIRELNEEYARLFVGGPALGARMLWDMMDANTDALAPESVCGFVTGPLTGSGAFFGGRYTFVCKTPVYNGFNDANAGGFFGPELKKAGFDALFITGKAEKPVYLLITNDSCEICDASHLWGLDYVECEEKLIKELATGRNLYKVRCAGIGNAGEMKSHISAVMSDGHRAAARGGCGLVLGSKNLKIIAVRGSKKVPCFDRQKMIDLNRETAKMTLEQKPPIRFYGTGMYTPGCILANDAGVKNWGGVGEKEYTPEEAEGLGSEYLDTKYLESRYSCSFCPLGCGAIYKVSDDKYPLEHTSRPEYETAVSFGPMMAIKDSKIAMICNELCNRYGLDTISAGATIAWAMETYEAGELAKEDLDGIELTWSNGGAAIELLEKMGKGEGCGAILLHGSHYAANYWNKGKDFLVVMSGVEPGYHDPRVYPGLARTYQYDPTPGRHVKGGPGYLYEEDKYDFSQQGPHKGINDVESTAYTELENASGLCQFASFELGLTNGAELIEAVTGWPFDLVEFGRRSLLIRQAFSVREGRKKEDYDISPRIVGEPPLEAGPTAGVWIDAKAMGERFFEELGCEADTFIPYKNILQKLGGMDDVAETIGV